MAITIDQDTASAAERLVRVSDRAKLHSTLRDSSHPILIHLNADTTWVLALPYPPSAERPPGRNRFYILLDPWFQGPQSDVASWFSTQWHVVAPSVKTIDELNRLLAELEGVATEETGDKLPSYIDTVAISHEFTDHCHKATLKEIPRDTPVFATEKAAALIRSWKHFDQVVTTPGFSPSTKNWQQVLSVAPLPSWVGIGRVITAGNALYYHSAVIIAFERDFTAATTDEEPKPTGAVIYSPHGIRGSDLESVKSAGIETLALLHGLHDVRIWMTKQLNLGALNGLEAIRASGAKYWIATHDEVKKGGGFIAPLLRRTTYTVADAVKKETKSLGEKSPDYHFVELASGDALILA